MAANYSGYAFPSVCEGGVFPPTFNGGMTLRDYFAAHASDPPFEWMRLVCNTDDPYDVGGGEICQRTAQWKYMQADAMLAARATNQPNA